jgi:hypothetical protein
MRIKWNFLLRFWAGLSKDEGFKTNFIHKIVMKIFSKLMQKSDEFGERLWMQLHLLDFKKNAFKIL